MALTADGRVAPSVMFLHPPASDTSTVGAGLRTGGLSVTAVPLAGEAWPAGGWDMVLVQATDLSPDVAAVAERLRRFRVRAPLMLWAPLQPNMLEEVIRSGFDFWLPADTPAAGVAAQIRAITRLTGPQSEAPQVLSVRGVTVDLQRREVVVNNRPVPLTPTEFRILAYMAALPGRVISHAELFREVHGYDASEQEAKDILKVHISRLRTKLVLAGVEDELIATVRGFGYLLERRARGAPAEDGDS